MKINCPEDNKQVEYSVCTTCLDYTDCPERQAASGQRIVAVGVCVISVIIIGVLIFI